MLAVVFKAPHSNSAFNYLNLADMGDGQWFTRNRGEDVVMICDKEVKLTEELVLYLRYFSPTADKNIRHSLKSFSNLPIKEE